MAIDPFTQAYQALWSVLEGHEGVAALVHLGNRIKLDDSETPKPRKESVLDDDLPEAMLVPMGMGEFNIHGSSASTKITQSFGLQITTCDIRVNVSNGLFPLKYELIKAISRIDNNLGLSFVKRVSVSAEEEQIDDDELNRGTRGWSMRFLIHVEMWLSRAELLL